MGSGSDYAPFIQKVGLPCADIEYIYNEVCYKMHCYGAVYLTLCKRPTGHILFRKIVNYQRSEEML